MTADLTESLCVRTGLRDRELGRRALLLVVSNLAASLPDGDAHRLSVEQPCTPGASVVSSAAELYRNVGARLSVTAGNSVEITRVILELLAEALPEELVVRMGKHLPADIARDLHPREVPIAPVAHRTLPVGPSDTLATGRATSEHPISEAPHRLRR